MTPSHRRRVFLGVAAAAAAAGAGVAWWRHEPQPVLSEAEQMFWRMSLEDPQGQPFTLAPMRGQPLLVNFWATWCPPCVEELPLLNRFFKAQSPRGWQVLGLAVDQPKAVQAFLKKLPLDFPVGMAGLAGTQLSRTLGNPNGGLPYTVVMDRLGVVRHQKVGQVSASDLEAWAADV
jgi:peroxiredoxin